MNINLLIQGISVSVQIKRSVPSLGPDFNKKLYYHPLMKITTWLCIFFAGFHGYLNPEEIHVTTLKQ